MENDSAQHATMAMRMARDSDFLNIFKGENPYLDKPHMHFWLSALSFKIFGFHVWAYRLPAILLTLFGAYGLKQLANLLYKNKEVGPLAALIFLSSFAIILSLHDVRTDAVLAAFTILASWQWFRFLKTSSLNGAILGGLFTAFAYATKGMLAVAIIGLFLFYAVTFLNLWKKLFNYKLLIGIAFFILGSLPMFYAYYHQFGWEGIEFITYGQSTGRFKGEDFGTASSNDYAFFFHTLLWAMLPWGLWFYYTTYIQGKAWIKKNNHTELITAATVLTFIIGMNFSSFKLPHYLNIVLPFAAIFTAGGFLDIYTKSSIHLKKLYTYTQYFIVGIGFVLGGILLYCFPIEHIIIIVVLIVALAIGIYFWLKATRLEKPILAAAGFILISAIYLNTTFYPSLIQYQANHQIGDYILEHDIPQKRVYNLSKKHTWATDWKLNRTIRTVEPKNIKDLQTPIYGIVYKEDPQSLFGSDYKVTKVFQTNHYRITRLKWKFLNPATRDQTLENAFLVKVEQR